MKTIKYAFIFFISIFVLYFSYKVINVSIENNNGKGNCMLVYTKHLNLGTKEGEVYLFPKGSKRVEGYHVEYIGSLNTLIGNYKEYKIGTIKGCDFSNSGMSKENALYNSIYCEFGRVMYNVIPDQYNEIGE